MIVMEGSVMANVKCSFEQNEIKTGDWLKITPKEVPLGAMNATSGSISGMISEVQSGGSAFNYLNSDCSIYFDGVQLRARIYFEVRHSKDLNYTLSSNYSISQATFSDKNFSLSINPEFKKVYELYKQCATFRYDFEGSTYYTEEGKAYKVDYLPSVTYDDGFIYFSDYIFGRIRIDGRETFETYYVEITHTPNTTYSETKIVVTAMFPSEKEVEDQRKEILTLDIPTCIIDKFNECSYDPYNPDMPGSGGDPGGVATEGQTIVYWDTCTGDILKKVKVSAEECQ
jgi:hypothetical protein